MTPFYASRESVKAAADFEPTARDDELIDEALDAGSRSVERLTHRIFYPVQATRRFPWPNDQLARSWRLWLGEDELVSATSVTTGDVTLTDYFLEPTNQGPPFDRIEIDLGSSASFEAGESWQRSIVVIGVWGYQLDDRAAAVLESAIADAVTTTVDVTVAPTIGIGDLIKVDTERMVVTEKGWLDTGQNLADPMTASVGDVSLLVTDGTVFARGETLLLDSEQMLVTSVSGNTLTVKRAWNGSVLAAHTTPDVYAPRRFTVERGALGTTAAAHADAAAVTRFVAPRMVSQLARAEALTTLAQDSSQWARVVGSGDNQTEAAGRGIGNLRSQVYDAYARKARPVPAI